MLSIFEADVGSFAVWMKDGDSELQIYVSDGQEVWRAPRPITGKDKPASRKHDSDEAFLSQLKKALKKDMSDSSGSFEVEIKPTGDDVQLVVKETIGTTTTKSILFKTTLERSVDRKGGFMIVFSQASEKMQKDVLEALSLNKSISEFKSLVDSLSHNTKDVNSMKEKLHDELITKFCMVLNTKKREIAHLKERIEELERQNDLTQNTQQSIVDLTTPKAASAAKAPRKAAAPKTTTMECVTGTKRKTAPRKASVSATARASSSRAVNKRRVETESEESEDEEEKEDDEDDDELNDTNSESGFDHSGGEASDLEADDAFEDVPTVTQSSLHELTQGADSTRSSAPGISTSKRSVRDSSKSSKSTNDNCVEAATGSSKTTALVTVSLPIPEAELPSASANNGAAMVQESESDEELFTRRRRSNAGSKDVPTPSNNHAVSTIAKATVTQPQHSIPIVSAVSGPKKTSKFLSEDSDEEENCMDFM